LVNKQKLKVKLILVGGYISLSEQGTIKGDVRVPNIILNGTVFGNVYAEEHIEFC